VSRLSGVGTRSSACGPSCRHASRHVCSIALSPQYSTDAKWRALQLSLVQLPPVTGMALRRLFGDDAAACVEATATLRETHLSADQAPLRETHLSVDQAPLRDDLSDDHAVSQRGGQQSHSRGRAATRDERSGEDAPGAARPAAPHHHGVRRAVDMGRHRAVGEPGDEKAHGRRGAMPTSSTPPTSSSPPSRSPSSSLALDPLASDGACQLLPSRWGTWVALSNGSKRSYFAQLRDAGGAIGHLSARRHFDTSHAPPPPAALANSTLRIGFVGDSVTREVAFAWHAIAPRAVALFVWSSDVAVLPPRTAAARALVDSFVGGAHPGGAQPCERDDHLDVLFVGLGSLEQLPRVRGTVSEATRVAALAAHRTLVARHLRDAAALSARAGGKPVVLVGTLPADVAILQLHPAKKDAFTRDWALAPKFVTLEAELLDAADATHPTHRRPATPLASPLVAFLRPSSLSERCPGVRCDGLHFGADFDSYACRSSFSLWYPFLAGFLVASGVLTRTAEASAHARGACMARPVPTPTPAGGGGTDTYCNHSLEAHSLVACASTQPRDAIPFAQSCFCHDAQSPPLERMRLKLPDRAQK
jgi:hypothetical protein